MVEYNNIKLNRKSNQYLYIQLYNELKSMILNGVLTPHTKLPPIRRLANLLKINNATVVNAYKLLEQEDLVYKKVGSGTFVKNINNKDIRYIETHSEERYLDEKNRNIINSNQIQINKNTINFASATPTPDLFPVTEFKSVLNEVLDRDRGNAFGYQESQGYLPLRKAIKKYLINSNIITTIDSIQIISGAQQGIDILSKALIDYGDIVFTENPTYAGAISSFKSRGARIIGIPIEKDGIDIKALENKLKSFKPKFIYVMPNFQNPTGYSYSVEKKNKLLELAYKHDLFIIEDDYLSDLSFFSSNNQTLKSLDTENKVIYIKSFSKIFMPGLRLAFMVTPISIYNKVIAAKHMSDISTSGLIQRAFDLYLRKGIWKKHINYMENIYKKRFEIMSDSIKKYIPKEVKYDLPKGGLNFWFSLPDKYSSWDLYNFSLKNNIIFMPGSIFYVNKEDDHHFRISIASIYSSQIENSIKYFSEVINSFLKKTNNEIEKGDSYRPIL
ncbi:PLP-dependent aminotransferase family protein [Thermohalobacter berrensis]|uniref:Transcriptional regulator n=1 Tax=Thermohalobacter berrensis TaxID=99594 RepID=A0A419TAL1_9FIRM|nr:PLP-dependent aminotransferase family protein [Thermohalobacter berrensis]RKD34519.1 transcriptional regulator [Thermohalobacter berrensis]